MSRVKLSDVAKEHKETLKGDKTNLPVVGLEHLSPKNIELEHWDINTENTFTKIFRRGNVLFGRRRAYLKKAAYARFDGICSGDITVIEAIPEKIIPELLPFIIQNDNLFDFAVGKSAGSLSPRVKWEHLSNYEFELPDSLEEQKKLANLLWSIIETKKSYHNLITKTQELTKSKFIELFSPEKGAENGFEIKMFDDVFEDMTKDGTKITTDNYLENGKYPIIDQGQDLVSGFRNDEDGLYSSVPAIIFGDHTRILKYIDFPFFLGADGVKLLKLKNKNNNYKYMYYALLTQEIPNEGYARHFKWLKKLEIVIPEISIQNKFAAFVNQTEKSINSLQKSIDELDGTMEKIVKDKFVLREE